MLFSPYALLFLNVLGGGHTASLNLDYRHTAASVGIVRGFVSIDLTTDLILDGSILESHWQLASLPDIR